MFASPSQTVHGAVLRPEAVADNNLASVYF